MARFISIKGLILNTKDIQMIDRSGDREVTIRNIINYLNIKEV